MFQSYDQSNLVLDKLGQKIVFVFVAPIIGGHEIMAINIIKKFSDFCDIDIYIPQSNKLLKDELNKNGMSYFEHNVEHKRVEIVHAFLNFIFKSQTKKLLTKLNSKYDSIVIVQGGIELGSVFLLEAKKSKIPVISYIPFTHSVKKMGGPLSLIRDYLSKFVYCSCDTFITIAPFFKSRLQEININAKVYILENFVEKLESMILNDQNKSESKKENVINIFIIGRVSFRQKGHDILIHSLEFVDKQIELNKNIILHVVGDGPDLVALKKLTNNKLTKIKVIYYGWVLNVWSLPTKPDLVVIPSRFEGVPLIMLESLERNIPIIASARDGMLDYLPKHSLYHGNNDDEDIINLSSLLNDFINQF